MKMKKTFKFLTMTVLLSMVGSLNGFAAELIGSKEFNDPDNKAVSYKSVSIDRDHDTGTVSVTGNNVASSETTLTIPGTITYSVDGEISGVPYKHENVVFTVVGIEANAFKTMTKLETLNIPASVVTIEEGAFNNAGQLKTVNIADGSKLKTVGNYVFGNTNIEELDLSMCSELNLCTGTPFLNAGGQENHQLKKVTLPAEIECIGQAFANISKLEELNLGDTKVTELEDGALANTSLTEVTIPVVGDPTVKTAKIGAGAFANTPIEKLVINAPISRKGDIAPGAFANMPKLTEVEFNGDLTCADAIPSPAFPNSKLESLKFGGEITKAGAIPAYAFKDQTALETISFDKDIAAGAIGANAFNNAGSCATVTYGGNLKGADAIGTSAFESASIKVLNFYGDIYGGAIGVSAFKGIDCPSGATIAFGKSEGVGGELVAANAINTSAFENGRINQIDFYGDIAGGAIAESAFKNIAPGTDGVKYVEFYGDLTGANAIGNAAFKGAKIGKLTFDGTIAAGAIAGASSQGGDGAFDFATCGSDIIFKGALMGADAIGQNAFYGATVTTSVVFDGNIAASGIGQYAFNALNTRTNNTPELKFNNKLLGKNAVDAYAFSGAQVKSVTFAKDITTDEAIAKNAFENLKKTTDGVSFKNIAGKLAVGYQAFKGAQVKSVTIDGTISGENAIAQQAFYGAGISTNKGDVEITGSITGKEGISAEAFKNSYFNKLSVGGDLTAEKAISDNAFENATLTELYVKGETANTKAISDYAFASNPFTKITLEGNIYATTAPAIAGFAFAEAAKGLATGAVLNLGNIKSSKAIEKGAFSDANFNEVNFHYLLAPLAINDYQFASISSLEIKPAKIKTVNFLNDLKKDDENKINSLYANLIGHRAFKLTKVEKVNFKGKVDVQNAIVANSAENSPFASNGAAMTIKFEKDVCEGAFGEYAFANSNTVAIDLNDNAKFDKLAFQANSFYAIANPFGTVSDPHVVITYNDPQTDVFRSFDEEAFYTETSEIDILFKTNEKVQKHYTTVYNYRDMTPYRMKLIVTKKIHLTESEKNPGLYFGVFDPQNEQYIIEKYQQGAEVNVVSAYVDDKTVEKTGNTFGNGEPNYKGKIYFNNLRIQDNGKYVLNAGHTLIVVADKDIVVEATQDLDGRWGGVQTFAMLTPWQCNDLRYNPAQIERIYNPETGDIVNGIEADDFAYENHLWGNSHIWPGEVNQSAIVNGDVDYYGNVLRDYAVFKQKVGELAMKNTQTLEEDRVYVLAAPNGGKPEYVDGKGETHAAQSQIELRELYSTKAAWGNTASIAFEQLLDRLQTIYEQGLKDGQNETLADIIDNVKEKYGVEDDGTPDGVPTTVTIEDLYSVINALNDAAKAAGEKDGYKKRLDENTDTQEPAVQNAWDALYAAIGQLPTKEQTKVDEEGNPVQKVDKEGNPVTETVIDEQTGSETTRPVYETETVIDPEQDPTGIYALIQALCKANAEVAAAEKALLYEDIIRCVEEDDELLGEFAGEKFSTTLEDLEGQIETLEGTLNTAELANRAETDDMYQQYLALKDIAGDAAEAAALLAEFDALSDAAKTVLETSERTGAMIDALPTEERDAMQTFGRKYARWANVRYGLNMPFDLLELQEAAKVHGDDLDDVVNVSDEDIDKPGTFKEGLDNAAAEAEEKVVLFEAYNEAAEGLDEDGHVMAAFKNMLWRKTNHYTMTIWSGNSQYASEVKTVDVIDVNARDLQVTIPSTYDGLEVRPFAVVEDDEDGLLVKGNVYGVVDGAYGADELSPIYAKQIVRLENDAWNLVGTAPFATLVTTPNKIKEYNPTNLYKNEPTDNSTVESLYSLFMEDLFDARGNILNVDEDELDVEAKSLYNLAKSMKDLLDNGLIETELVAPQYESYGADYDTEMYPNMYTFNLDDIEEAAETAAQAAKEAREAAAAWLIKWYAQAVHENATTIDEESTYSLVAADLLTQAKIDDLQAQIDALEDLPCYQAYADAKVALKEATDAIPEKADAVLNAYLAIGDLIAALEEAIKDIDEGNTMGDARLQIIWNDESMVTGIMEHVVRGDAATIKSEAVYNLNGMRVNKAQKGVFIQNGKKIIQ